MTNDISLKGDLIQTIRLVLCPHSMELCLSSGGKEEVEVNDERTEV